MSAPRSQRQEGIAALAALGCAVALGCAPVGYPGGEPPSTGAPGIDEPGLANLNAVLWVQSAAEYRGTAWQAFELARRALDDALADRAWTAALEQTGDYQNLPPAVVLDIDETVLDNSYFEARLTLDRATYSPELWDEWVLQEAATPVPGALEFCRYAAESGVTVFYVSNRRAHLEDATRANLSALGFPLGDGDLDTVLLRGEEPEWESSNKTPRRARVAETHRILLLLGDNMGDFVGAADGNVEQRRRFAEQHRDYWGRGWITLPNPTYGSWLGAVLDNDYSMPVPLQIEVKKNALDPLR